MNTKIVYGNYERPDASILKGVFTQAQQRRLDLIGWSLRLDAALCDRLGLARTGGSFRPERFVATLEAPTNPRVDAAKFYAIVLPLGIRFAFDGYGDTAKHYTACVNRISRDLAGKKPGVPISTAHRPWTLVESHQSSIASVMRSLMRPYVTAAALAGDPSKVLPRTLKDIGIDRPIAEFNNDETQILLPAAWAMTMRGESLPRVLFDAMTPNASVTPEQVREALEHVRRFCAQVTADMKRIK